jgi:hypothetical protein
MSRRRGAVVKGRSILALDVLGEVRRAMRVLRRVEKFLVQQERRGKVHQARIANARAAVGKALDLAGQA